MTCYVCWHADNTSLKWHQIDLLPGMSLNRKNLISWLVGSELVGHEVFWLCYQASIPETKQISQHSCSDRYRLQWRQNPLSRYSIQHFLSIYCELRIRKDFSARDIQGEKGNFFYKLQSYSCLQVSRSSLIGTEHIPPLPLVEGVVYRRNRLDMSEWCRKSAFIAAGVSFYPDKY